MIDCLNFLLIVQPVGDVFNFLFKLSIQEFFKYCTFEYFGAAEDFRRFLC